MSRFRTCASAVLAVAVAALPALALDPPAYVHAEDPSYKWTEKTTHDLEGCQVTVIRLTSQTWQGIKWRHWVHVIRPAEVEHPDQALLVIGGGNSSKKEPGAKTLEVQLLRDVAVRTKSVIAVVGQVPNQPLFEDKYEDGLIAYTFQKYLDTGDETWPCLLPMAKSAIRAMDCVQAFVKDRDKREIKSFVVTGASKRGWTTWLAAAFDARVEAIAPMVIDTLNFPKQMPLQVESFGGFSEQIRDYTELDLPKKMQTEEGARLVAMVDPYSYRERLAVPKLIVLGTNDRYWPVDAVKMYFADLPGEKLIHYCPNAGHGLGEGVVEATAAFYADVLAKRERPKLEWTTVVRDGAAATKLTLKDEPIRTELWTAASETRDFRKARWAPAELECKDGRCEAVVKVPEKGFSAYHVRVTYRSALGDEYGLCTNVEVLKAEK